MTTLSVRRVPVVVAAAAVLLAGLGSATGQAAAASSSESPRAGTPSCDRNPEMRSNGHDSSGRGIADDVRWAMASKADAALTGLGALAADESVVGVLGLQVDYPGRRAILVYSDDMSAAELEEVKTRARAIAGDAFPLSFQPSCATESAVAAVRSLIEGGDLPESSGGKFTHVNGYDPDSGRLTWQLPESASDIVPEVRRRLGADAHALEVVLTDGPPAVPVAGTRGADGSPFWGGAVIQTPLGSCTSGFTMLQNLTLFLTSAGHCATGNDSAVTSGSGATVGRVRNNTYPNPDLLSVWPTLGQQHDNWIHTSGGEDAQNSREVTSRIRNGVTSFCTSGAVTLANCGVTAQASNDTICYADGGCVTNLYRASESGQVVVRRGDSGGPAYGREGTAASARGVIIASGNNGTIIYMHNIGTLENQTGAGVATA